MLNAMRIINPEQITCCLPLALRKKIKIDDVTFEKTPGTPMDSEKIVGRKCLHYVSSS